MYRAYTYWKCIEQNVNSRVVELHMVFIAIFFFDLLNAFGLRELYLVNYSSFALGHKLLALKSLCSFQSAEYSLLDWLIWSLKRFFKSD